MVPQFTATTELNEPYQQVENNNALTQQSLSETGLQQANKVQNLLGQPFNYANAPKRGNLNGFNTQFNNVTGMGPELGTLDGMPMTYGDENSAARVQSVEDALFARLDERLGDDKRALDAELAGKGIAMGSDAYRRAMDQYGEDRNDARMSAVLGAAQEDSRLQNIAAQQAAFERQGYALQNADRDADSNTMYGRELQRTGERTANQQMKNNAVLQEKAGQDAMRQSYIEEELLRRNQPLNEIIGLMSGTQISGPNFSQVNMPSIAPVDIAGIFGQDYQNQLSYAQQQNALPLAMLGGGFNLGAGALSGGYF